MVFNGTGLPARKAACQLEVGRDGCGNRNRIDAWIGEGLERGVVSKAGSTAHSSSVGTQSLMLTMCSGRNEVAGQFGPRAIADNTNANHGWPPRNCRLPIADVNWFLFGFSRTFKITGDDLRPLDHHHYRTEKMLGYNWQLAILTLRAGSWYRKWFVR